MSWNWRCTSYWLRISLSHDKNISKDLVLDLPCKNFLRSLKIASYCKITNMVPTQQTYGLQPYPINNTNHRVPIFSTDKFMWSGLTQGGYSRVLKDPKRLFCLLIKKFINQLNPFSNLQYRQSTFPSTKFDIPIFYIIFEPTFPPFISYF